MQTSHRGRRAALWLAAASLWSAALGVAHAASTTVTISQIYGGGETTGASVPPAPYKQDFIELFNKSAGPIDLSTWSIQYAAATGTSWTKVNLTGTLASGHYYLIQGHTATAPAEGVALPNADLIATAFSLSATTGKVALVSNQTALTGANPTGAQIVDLVGYGAANGYETAPTAAPTQGSSVTRLDGGCTDRDNNSLDFNVGTVVPHNSASSPQGTCPSTPPGITALTVNPTRINAGDAFGLSATLYTGTGAASIATVTADLRTFGGGAAVALSEVGTSNVYTLTSFTTSNTTPAGFQNIPVTVTDVNGRTSTKIVQITVNYVGDILTVAAARQLPINSIFKVRGIVVDDSDGNPYMQDPDSANTGNAGNLIFDSRTLDGAYPAVIGDDVTVTGYLGTFGNELEFVPLSPPSDIVVNSHNNTLIAPKLLDIPTVSANDTDQYEGQLVTIKGLTVVSLNDASATAGFAICTGAASGGGFGSNAAPVLTLQDASGNQIALYLHRNATVGAVGSCDPDPAVPSVPGFPGLTSTRTYYPHDPIPATLDSSNGCGSATKITFSAATVQNGGVQTPTLYDVKVGNIFDVTGSLGERSAPAGGGPVKILRPRFVDDMVFKGVNVIIGAIASGGSPLGSQFEQGQTAHLSIKTSPATGSTVTADMTQFGGSATQPLTYVSANGDYEYDLTLPSTAPLGNVNIPITATNAGNALGTANGQVSILVTTPVMTGLTLAQIRTLPEYTKVDAKGTVTANSINSTLSFQIQDATGGVLGFSDPALGLANVGDSFEVIGYKNTFNGMIEVTYSGNQPSIDAGVEITPRRSTIAEYPGLEGDLVVSTVQIIGVAPGASSGNAYTVIDSTGQTAELYIHLNADVFDQSFLTPGSQWDITGVVDYFNDSARNLIRLKPRGPNDFASPATAIKVPSQIAFSTEPGGATAGTPFTTQPVLTVKNADGTTATAYNGTVSLSIKNGTGTSGAVLNGTTTVTAINGVATFSGLSIDKPGTGYVLTATTPIGYAQYTPGTPVTVDSTPFTVGQGAFTTADVIRAFRIAGGIISATTGDVAGYNVQTGETPEQINLRDVVGLAMKVSGHDPNNP